MKLSQCKIESEGVIESIVESDFDSKLMEFGIIPGAKIKVINKAPFNGPIYVSFGSQRIAIRKQEASSIILK